MPGIREPGFTTFPTRYGHIRWLIVAILFCLPANPIAAAEAVVPHNQDAPPGPALSPQEALARMEVPPGFEVELVASEPQIVNPVAMTFDERGRIWITESLEYPRREPGPGRDRVKILEDTDGDGTVDSVKIFAEGLNIPSGIAVGHGGVWVANSPDILFLQDLNGDDRADKSEVVVTGFGRFDTHELPNSLTWGPDGWLYGLNGVFNPGHVKQGDKEFRFTCALFRIHPRTREFQLFAEGTSNPWGIAWDRDGSAFLSACVIDHLWHLAETGYYHRQGGPYPPFTWKIESIVNHKHQKAAYCGIHYFDSDAYPPEYRERLYMGNIHGNCINVDSLEKNGATYKGIGQPDFLHANDVWFMPVVQKTGPDGCLYILDWYDRYHCYQDANRDPAGIDRLKGRLYRVRYQGTPRPERFDLAAESDDQLIARLGHPNVYYPDIAQRILCERAEPSSRIKLRELVLDSSASRKARLHALWALIGGGELEPQFHTELFEHEDPAFRAWAARAAGNQGNVPAAIEAALWQAVEDPAPEVRLRAVVALRKTARDAERLISALVQVAATCGDDPLLPRIAWRGLEPLLENHTTAFLTHLGRHDLRRSPGLSGMLPFAIDRILAREEGDTASVAKLFELLASSELAGQTAAGQLLESLAERVQSGEIAGQELVELKAALEPHTARILSQAEEELYLDAAFLTAAWRDPAGMEVVRELLVSSNVKEESRLQALEALVAAEDLGLLSVVPHLLTGSAATSNAFSGQVIAALGRLNEPAVAEVLLAVYADLNATLRPKAIELLTQRGIWARPLLAAIGQETLAPSVLNVNQVRKLAASPDAEIAEAVREIWGSVRGERDADRERVVYRMRRHLQAHRGNPLAGEKVFARVCGQCHKMHGSGQEVGPDITRNGRASFDQLLSNVFDPSLVIGTAYQAHTVVTDDGRVLSGLVKEDSPQRIILKVEGGKEELIPRKQVELFQASGLSLMPEKLEQQLSPTELADLFAYLTLDLPPHNADAEWIPGATPLAYEDVTLPENLSNLFAIARWDTNADELGAEIQGRIQHVLWHPSRRSFVWSSSSKSFTFAWNEDAPAATEAKSVTLTARWNEPIEANLLSLRGADDATASGMAWKIEFQQEGQWVLLEQGQGDWYAEGGFLWGGAGATPLRMSAIRISFFSPDGKTPLKSVKLRGDAGRAWVLASVPPGASLAEQHSTE